MSIMKLNEGVNVSADVREVDVRKVPFGTFTGTVYGLVVLRNGESLALDVGDQGGGQN
jgi:hypothetical protein